MVDSAKPKNFKQNPLPWNTRMYMSIEEQTQVLRSFKNFDLSGDGKICQTEFQGLLKDMGRTDITPEQVQAQFSKYDLDSNGQLDFHEYLKMCMEISENHKAFGKQSSKIDEHMKIENESSGAFSTFSKEEKRTFTKLFNSTLKNDPFVGERFPIDANNEDIWYAMQDGMVLISLVNVIQKDTVDMRVVNFGKEGLPNIYEVKQNIDLGINSCRGLIKVTGTNHNDFLEKKPIKLLGMFWQLARLIAVKKIQLNDCPEIYRLLKDGEELSDLLKCPPEDILIRWVNYHLRAADQHDRQISNLGKDLKDSQAMFYVLNQLDKNKCSLDKMNEEDKVKRAEEMMKNSAAINVPDVVDPNDWVQGNSKVNSIYVAEVFNTRHGLQELDKEERDKCGLDEDLEGSREERQFRLWINSLEIPDCTVNNLYEDVRDGQVLLKVIHKIDETVVEWDRVQKNANNHFKISINCQVAFDALKKLKVKTVGIGHIDIQDGNKKLILALIWQLMRVHYMKIIGNKSDQVIIDWANGVKGNENLQVKNFKDANLKTGVFLINLTAAIDPEIINWDLVNMDPNDEEALSLNARYAISIARKLGAVIFMVWEDVLELNSKMMTIFMSSLYELWEEKQ